MKRREETKSEVEYWRRERDRSRRGEMRLDGFPYATRWMSAKCTQQNLSVLACRLTIHAKILLLVLSAPRTTLSCKGVLHGSFSTCDYVKTWREVVCGCAGMFRRHTSRSCSRISRLSCAAQPPPINQSINPTRRSCSMGTRAQGCWARRTRATAHCRTFPRCH